MLVTVENGKIKSIEGDPDSTTLGTLCAKGLASVQEVYNPNRLKYPMKRKGERGGGKWERISWKEALDTIARKMKENIEKFGPASIALSVGTGRGYNRYIARFTYSIGTPNILGVAHICYFPKLAVFTNMVGGRLYCDYHGWGGEYPKVHISWGKQLEITNSDGEMAVWFLKALDKADHLILIDPRATRLAKKADLWLRLRPGTDAALALGMLNVIISEELYDKDFVENWTHGFDKLAERVKEYPPEKVEVITWVPKNKIIEAARIFATNKPGVIQVGEAVEGSINSTQNISSIICLMAVTGNIERPGGMVSWVPPDTGPVEDFGLEIPAPQDPPVGADFAPFFFFGPIKIAHPPTVFKELKEGQCIIKVLHVEGGNLLMSCENTKEVLEGLLNLEFISVADLYMSTLAEYADIVLPVAHWLETDDIYDMHPRFIISAVQKAVEPLGEAWPDNKILNELGKRIAPQYWFRNVEEMLDYILRKAGITWKEFKEKGILAKMGKEQIYYKYKTDYWKEGGGFGTPTGKVELYSTIMEALGRDPLPSFKEPPESPYSTPELYKEYPLILSTGGRLPYYFHSQYRQTPWLRELQHHPLVQIHPQTAEELAIKEGDWVWIETPRGRIKQVAKLFEGIHPKVVVAQASWWYPEDPGPDHGMWNNINVLTSSDPPYDPCVGSTSLRAMLCKVYKVEGGG